jgi:hypothetical protein
MRLVVVLIFLISCASEQVLSPPPPKSLDIILPEIRVESPIIKEAPRTKVHLTLSKFNDNQASRLIAVGKKVEEIINLPQFKEKVINFYTNKVRKFNETNDTNERVYQTLMSKEWDVKIELGTARKKTLGWTYPSTPWIWFNSKNFNAREDSGLAGTICHEWSHKLGYGHSARYYRGREYTVPYAIGTICAEFYR